MQNYKKHIRLLLDLLESKSLLVFCRKDPCFFDEPKFFLYSAELDDSLRFLKLDTNEYYKSRINEAISNTLSFTSREKAIVQCLEECINKICIYLYPKNGTKFDTFFNLNQESLVPELITSDHGMQNRKIGWLKGFNYTKGIGSLIPAQLIYHQYRNYMIYQRNITEKNFSLPLITGLSGDFNYDSALLKGIYDLIEKDVCMTTFLLQYSPERLDIYSTDDNEIRKIFRTFQKYKFDWQLFNITNDLGIPTFLSLIIDKSGREPILSTGVATNINIKEAIISSVEKASLFRYLGRNEIYYDKKASKSKIPSDQISTISRRILYWSSAKKLSLLNYLLDQEPHKYKISKKFINPNKQLSKLKIMLAERGFQIFYSDITIDIFKKINYFACKVVIPGLQPFYQDEQDKRINIDRLKVVSKYFGQKTFRINNIPHFYI